MNIYQDGNSTHKSVIDLELMGVYRQNILGYEVKFTNAVWGTLVKSHPVVEKSGRVVGGFYEWHSCTNLNTWTKISDTEILVENVSE